MTLDLGTTSLSQVRLARGLTLEDAERSTRISRKFLIALEEHDYSVFPAPVYARGFLRTYCRYLGVDPEAQLAELPAGWTESITPVTQVAPVASPRAPMTFNMAYIVAGALLMAIIGAGIFLSRGGGDLGALEEQRALQTQVPTDGAVASDAAANDAQTQPTSTPDRGSNVATSQRRALAPGLPGTLPDFEFVDVDEVTAYLDQQDITYVQIVAASRSVEAGLVISQTPDAGANTEDLTQVTITVSSGSTPALTNRTDCDVLAASTQRTAAEQTYFESNCAGSTEETLPDRTACEEIRGTDYRSPAEREFFLTNCIIG